MPQFLMLSICLFPGLLFAQVPDAREPAEKQNGADAPLSLTDARFGAWYPGTDDELRWLAIRAEVTNTSDAEMSVPATAWQLTVDGEVVPIRSLLDDPEDLSIFIGGEIIEVGDFSVDNLKIAAGDSGKTWLTFSGLSPGTHVPRMTLACDIGNGRKLSADINQVYADRLKLSVERLGPGKGLALLQVAGELDTINVGTLAQSIDGLINDGLDRFVVSLSGSTDFEVLDWLKQVASTSGLSEMYHDRFPDFPSEELSLRLVNPESDEASGVAVPAWLGRNNHGSLDDAVIAAIGPLARQAPRGAILTEIRAGHPLSRVATLVHGAEKLAADDVPLLMRLTQDDSPELRQAAVFGLRHFGEPVAVAALTRLSLSEDGELAEVAVESLATSRYVAAHTALAEMLTIDDAVLRRRVVAAMAGRPRPDWSAPLYRLASAGDGELRAEVLSALTAVGHPKLHALLRQSLTDDDATLSTAALEQLMKHDDPESEQLAMQWTLRQLEDTPPSRNMLQFLKRTRDVRSVPLLMKHVGDEPSKQRVALVEAILNIGDERAAEELGKRFDSLKNSERMLVLNTLRAVDSPQFRGLAESVMRGESGKAVDSVAELLSEDSSPWAIDLLGGALKKATKRNRYAALCGALAQSSAPEARRILRQAAGPDAQRFRGVARQALEILYENSPAMQFVIQGQSARRNDANPILAMLYFDLAVEVDPDLPDARLERGNTIMQQPDVTAERLQVAHDDFTRLVEIDDRDSFGHTGLALVDVRTGSIERGIETGEKLRESHKDDPVFLYNMACIYGRAIEALEQREKPPENRDEVVREYQQKAISDLRGAVNLGLDEYNVEWMTRDPDLEPVRRHPDFENLFEPAGERDADE